MSASPVYSELWFILLFALLGLFLLAILIGLVLKRYFIINSLHNLLILIMCCVIVNYINVDNLASIIH